MQIKWLLEASSWAMRSAQSGRKLGGRAERNCGLLVSDGFLRLSPRSDNSNCESIEEVKSYCVVINEIKLSISFDIGHPIGAKEVAMQELDCSGSRILIFYWIFVAVGFLLLVASCDGGLAHFKTKGIITKAGEQQDIIALSAPWHERSLPSLLSKIIVDEACAQQMPLIDQSIAEGWIRDTAIPGQEVAFIPQVRPSVGMFGGITREVGHQACTILLQRHDYKVCCMFVTLKFLSVKPPLFLPPHKNRRMSSLCRHVCL